jgi:hypothetical protein
MKKKVVLIGDIIASKKLKNQRVKVQEKLSGILEQLNNENQNILSPYTITLGDEFQSVFESADRLFCDILSILVALHPVKVRFSVGIGDIKTPLNREQALGMDGEAFYNARDGLNKLKIEESNLIIIGFDEKNQRLIELTLLLISNKITKWKKNRLQILEGLCEDLPVKKMAEYLDITDKAIYKNIDDGGLKVIKQLLCEIENVIDRSIV